MYCISWADYPNLLCKSEFFYDHSKNKTPLGKSTFCRLLLRAYRVLPPSTAIKLLCTLFSSRRWRIVSARQSNKLRCARARITRTIFCIWNRQQPTASADTAVHLPQAAALPATSLDFPQSITRNFFSLYFERDTLVPSFSFRIDDDFRLCSGCIFTKLT